MPTTTLSTLLADLARQHDEDLDIAVATATALAEIERLLADAEVAVAYAEPEIEEQGGSTYAIHDAEIRIGVCDGRAHAWSLCGWLARGASCDLDGSGLEAWGDSQRGGWTYCDGDGAQDGRVHAEATGEVLSVHGADGGGTDSTWTVAHILGLSDADALIVAAHLEIDAAMDALAERVNEALVAERPCIAEPSAEDVWGQLDGKRRTVEIGESVRAGHPWGESQVIVVVHDADGEYTSYMASESWEAAAAAAAGTEAVASIQAEVDRDGDR